MSKLYFSGIDDGCQTLKYLKWAMENEGIKEIEVIEAKIEKGTGYFYCTYFEETGEVGESCGKVCEKYEPRNHKNGRCRFSANCYEPTDKRKIIRIKEAR